MFMFVQVTEDTYIISHFLYRHINEPDGQDRPATDDDDYAQVKKLYQWLSQILIPPGYILGQWDNDKVEDDDYDEDDGGEQDTQQRDQGDYVLSLILAPLVSFSRTSVQVCLYIKKFLYRTHRRRHKTRPPSERGSTSGKATDGR